MLSDFLWATRLTFSLLNRLDKSAFLGAVVLVVLDADGLDVDQREAQAMSERSNVKKQDN